MFKAHWNRRYIADRSKEFIFRKLNPQYPWLTQGAIAFLKLWLSKTDAGLEFGSGRSTVWLADRTKSLISIEDNKEWFDKMSLRVKELDIKNVDYRFCKTNAEEKPSDSDYCKPLAEFPDANFDYILVDGTYRDYIALNALPKLRTGGLMIVDNANWFLPHETFSPTSIGTGNPPLNAAWKEFYAKVSGWREIWTSNGVTDTAIFIKNQD